MRLAVVSGVLLGGALVSAPALHAETLIASLSTTRVLISSNYTGSTVVLFGAIERDAQSISRGSPYQVVVTVRGPRQTLVVREKRQVGPIWVNRAQEKFAQMPTFLGVLSSAPITDVTSDALRRRFRIGLDAIVDAPDWTKPQAASQAVQQDAFRQALLRLGTRDGLYFQDESGVTFLTPTMFRATIPVPATAPPGPYDVEVALFADGALLARSYPGFALAKIGFEQQVAELAHELSTLYGLGTAGMALLFGWLASVVFRRD
jgi:uncharacterized protein (TIGR02186 family)